MKYTNREAQVKTQEELHKRLTIEFVKSAFWCPNTLERRSKLLLGSKI
jgi:hypothetical protein